MNAKQHLQKVHESQALHIAEIVRCLNSDPLADKKDIDYSNRILTEYLWELIDKRGNVLSGLIVAIEHYLEK